MSSRSLNEMVKFFFVDGKDSITVTSPWTPYKLNERDMTRYQLWQGNISSLFYQSSALYKKNVFIVLTFQERTLEEHKKLVDRVVKRDKKRRKRIEAAGIDYECPEIVSFSPLLIFLFIRCFDCPCLDLSHFMSNFCFRWVTSILLQRRLSSKTKQVICFLFKSSTIHLGEDSGSSYVYILHLLL